MLVGVDIETIGLLGPAYAIAAVTESNQKYLWMGQISSVEQTVSWTDKQMTEMKRVLDGGSWVGHNIGLFDESRLNAIGLYANKIFDTLPASHVYNSFESHTAKDLAVKYLRMPVDDESTLKSLTEQSKALVKASREFELRGRNSKVLASLSLRQIHFYSRIDAPEGDWQNAMWLTRVVFPDEKITGWYVMNDAERALRLWTGRGRFPGYARLLDALDLRKFYDTHIEYQKVVLSIKSRGIRFFKDRAEKRLIHLKQKASTIEQDFETEYKTNVASPKQLAELIFCRLEMPIVKHGKSQPSTDKEVIKSLLERHATHKHIGAIKRIRDYRETTTDAGDVNDYLAYVDGNGIIHPDINPTATGTTRGSCSNPALQNVNKKEERTQRDLFGPREGCWWYLFDYNQLELRILAWMADETHLQKWLDDGKEVYQFLGDASCKRVGLRKLVGTKTARDLGKTLNFAIMYGAGAPKVAETILLRLDLTIDRPQLLIDTYFEMFPKARIFQQESIHFAETHGLAITGHGYRLRTPPDEPHTSVDYRIQGTAGWIAKEASVRLRNNVAEIGSSVFFALDIHDELALEGKKNLSNRILRSIKHEMESNGLVSSDGRPLVTPVNLKVAKRHWAEKIEIKLA